METTPAPQPQPKTITAPPEEVPEPQVSNRQETPASSEVQPPKGMSIQALVWSEQRPARFAVINGSIVREGDRVSDAIVTEILKDSVRFTSSRGVFSLKRGQTP